MSSFFSPFTPNHVNLVNACYPSSSALVASGSTCQPNPQELSRLTYYASNKAESSGKLAKIGIELEKRASTEARKARSGNARARAQLLVTISIFKAITNECKRDVGLFTKMLLSAVKDALTCLPNDLELQARVASLFTAWATFSDGGVIGPDAKATADYMNILNTFKDRCTLTGKDTEHVSRMRLIGIAAMTAAVSSDEFYTTPAMFSKQAGITIPALVSSFYEAETHLLAAESTVVSADPSPNSPYLSEFQPRPVMDRRAASIHAHVDGETGPELPDVVNASLRALRTLLSRCNGSQVAVAFDFMLQSIDKAKLWDKPEVGKWYAQHAIEWTQYQYRYAVPTHLVDRLLTIQDSPTPIPKLFVTVEMLTYIFNSPTPLINLSTSDIITSLITVLLRRVSIDPNDGLLSPLVECISSLGTHVYYADQIHDLAEEVVGRLVNVQVNGVLGRGRGGNEAARETALRCLLACLSGLTEAADRNAAKYLAKLAEDGDTTTPAETTDGERAPSESTSTTIRAARRNKVSPESWQETLALLCESDYAIRSMYARGLTKFIQKEVKREPFVQNVEASQASLSRTAKVIVDPDFKASSRPSILASDSVSRFLNALHATIYTLATSSAASARPKSRVEAEGPSVNIIPPSSSNLPTPNNPPPPAAIDFVVKPPSTGSSVHGNGDHPPPTATSAASTVSSYMPGGEMSPINPGDSHRRHSRQTNGNRKLSIALSLLDGTQAGVHSTLSDFAFLREILMSAHRQVPTRAVLTGVPLLIALDQWTRRASCIDGCHHGYLHAVREMVCNVWMVIGEVWDVPSVAENASKALETLRPDILPNLDPVSPTQLHPPEVPIHFSSAPDARKIDSCGCIDAEVALPALASSAGLQAITGLDRQGLLRRFMIEWSVEGALKDSVEQTSNQDILRGDAPFLRLSPALMHIENMSLASLARSTGGGVGVNDLREALGRGSVSNPALATASLSSTVDRSSSMMRRLDKGDHPEPLAISRIKSKRGRAPPSEVRDVLNKLGIGKQSSGGTTLRAPFLQSSNEASKTDKDGLKRDTSLAEPPY